MQLDELELRLGRFKIARRIMIMHAGARIKVWEPERRDSDRPRWTVSFVWNKNHIAKSQFIYQFRVVFENYLSDLLLQAVIIYETNLVKITI